MSEKHLKTADKSRIDWMITLVPFILIMGLAVYLFIFPEQANGVISQVRFFFGDTLGSYYIIIGIGVLIVSLFLSFVFCDRSFDHHGEPGRTGQKSAGRERGLCAVALPDPVLSLPAAFHVISYGCGTG